MSQGDSNSNPDPLELDDWIRAGLPSAEKLAPGDRVGDFCLEEFLGAGGMGQVWSARESGLGDRRIALKLLPVDARGRELAAFRREAEAGSRLAHPGLVAIHARGEDNRRSWIAMELVEGGRTLRDWIHERLGLEVLPADHDRRAAELVARIADAVAALHGADVIHRDLKPANVLLAADGSPKVTDFGIARIETDQPITRTGETPGTYAYMSPEQFAGKSQLVDRRSDVFSLGVVLYEMIALRRPFAGDNPLQVSRRILGEDPPSLRSLRSRVPADLGVIVAKTLEKEARRRYSTMTAFAADLQRFLEGRPIHARPAGPWSRSGKLIRRNPGRSGVIAIATLALVAVSILLGQNLKANTRLEQTVEALDAMNRDLVTKTTEAESLARDVLNLADLQELRDLEREAADLWPATPELIEAYGEWIARAQALEDRLPLHRRQYETIAARALPRTDEERQHDRRTHPDRATLEVLEGRIAKAERAMAQRRDNVEIELPEVDWAEYPSDPIALDTLAWEFIDIEDANPGREPLGLVLAEEALARVGPDQEGQVANTVAWANLALGRDAQALEASELSVLAAPPGRESEFQEHADLIKRRVAERSSEIGRRAAKGRLESLRAEHARLDAQIDQRRTWRFPGGDTSSRWWMLQLESLIRGVEQLRNPGTGLLADRGNSAENGWSILRRRRVARELADGFAPEGDFTARWKRDLPAIRERYPGLELEAQLGLVPIGPDPITGLWEFWHVVSGAEPERDAAGKILLRESTGLVLVLLPGGRETLGATHLPSGPNYDPDGQYDEGPPHPVALSPFFLSKYELNQAQYLWITALDPSYSVADGPQPVKNVPWRNPVEPVSWFDAVEAASRLGLVLPTEAQWEYACRAGTTTVFSTGDRATSLAGHANLADEGSADAWAGGLMVEPGFDDGFVRQAPVDALEANGFGLHSMHGNVWEWCFDGYHKEAYLRVHLKDPYHEPMNDRRVVRGGSFMTRALQCRSASRFQMPADSGNQSVGFRPARPVQR